MRDYKVKRRESEKKVNKNSKLVSRDRWYTKLEHSKVCDMNIFNEGVKWFYSGLSLDDAPDELRNNFNFINGFKKTERLEGINSELEALGIEWFNNGFNLEDASDSYLRSPYFRQGFEKAKEQASKKTL